jgi:hypothetical protein
MFRKSLFGWDKFGGLQHFLSKMDDPSLSSHQRALVLADRKYGVVPDVGQGDTLGRLGRRLAIFFQDVFNSESAFPEEGRQRT